MVCSFSRLLCKLCTGLVAQGCSTYVCHGAFLILFNCCVDTARFRKAHSLIHLLMTEFWDYAWSLNNEVSLLLAGPGISGYSHATEKAGPSLAQCLQQAEEVIPSAQHKETPVYLGATAGMRLLRYCRACPLSSELHLGVQWGPLRSSPWMHCQLTLCQIPSSAPDLSEPRVPCAFPLLPRSLQPSIISCIHRSTETAGDQQCPS